jgi:predicted Zn-ribbon and HTH transcriptional regulator
MATVTVETFRCMACGHEYEEKVGKGEDKERTCPKCRSNSIRHLKKKSHEPAGAREIGGGRG